MYISQTAVVLANIWENMVDQYVVVVPPKHTHIRMSRLWQMWREWGSFACWRCAWTGSPTMYGACSYRNANTHTHTHRVNTTLRHTRCKNLSSGVAKHLSLLPDLGFLSSFRLSGSFAVRFFFFPFFLPSISVLNIRTNFLFSVLLLKNVYIFHCILTALVFFVSLFVWPRVWCSVIDSIRLYGCSCWLPLKLSPLSPRKQHSVILQYTKQSQTCVALQNFIQSNDATLYVTLRVNVCSVQEAKIKSLQPL